MIEECGIDYLLANLPPRMYVWNSEIGALIPYEPRELETEFDITEKISYDKGVRTRRIMPPL